MQTLDDAFQPQDCSTNPASEIDEWSEKFDACKCLVHKKSKCRLHQKSTFFLKKALIMWGVWIKQRNVPNFDPLTLIFRICGGTFSEINTKMIYFQWTRSKHC